MGADVSTIEHTGATSFTISSSGTDGSVNIESMNVKTGVVTGLTALTTTALTTNDITMGADVSTIDTRAPRLSQFHRRGQMAA